MSKQNAEHCADPKWRALVDDVGIPMPQQVVGVRVLRTQANLADEFILVRDHNSPEDVALDDDQTVDLAEGNVFYRLPRCDSRPPGGCGAPPKLAFFVDDRPELTTNPKQTGSSIRALFSLEPQASLVRDFESPNDEAIDPESDVRFEDGPVFISRHVKNDFTIVVNGRQRTVSKSVLTFDEIVALAFDNPPQGEFICFTITYRGGVCTKPEGMVVEGESVEIKEGMVFNVTVTDKS